MSSPDPAQAYRLQRPDIAEARTALRQLYGHRTDDLWRTLLTRAGLSGYETDEASLTRLLTAMTDTDPVMALCARSLTIRMNAHTHLTAAHTLIRDAE
ncbi:hypothetical protein [Actinoplanes sp. NPDC051859]|uniref:hypothetical protein n=1 Tax=Actinoplanes sp. NPDC051859 TaxID=3363909 RepID=UPI0037914F64